MIREFAGKSRLGFSTQDVIRAFPERKRLYLTSLLAEMVTQGMLHKVLATRLPVLRMGD